MRNQTMRAPLIDPDTLPWPEIVARYQAGETMQALAAEFGFGHQATLARHMMSRCPAIPIRDHTDASRLRGKQIREKRAREKRAREKPALKRKMPSLPAMATRDKDIPPPARVIVAVIKCAIEDMASERASVRRQAREYLDGEMLDYHCGLLGLDAAYVRRMVVERYGAAGPRRRAEF